MQGRYHLALLMRFKRFIPALGAFFVLGVALAGCGSGVPGNSVASVAGNPITLQAFNHWMFVAAKSQAAQNPGEPVIVPSGPPNFATCVHTIKAEVPNLPKGTTDKQLKSDCNQLFASYSSQVMAFLITSYWYQAEAAKQNIKVSDASVNKTLQSAVKSEFPNQAEFKSFLSQTGQTQPDITFRFRIQQIYAKLLAKQTQKVTPAQIQAYYNSHISQFGTPETRNIRIVLTKTQAQASAAKAALASGKSWNTIAKQDSIDSTTKDKGGLLSGVTKGSQDAALDNAAFAAPANQLEGPVQGQFGYYVFEVVGIKAGTQKTLAQATSTIKQTLTTQNQNSASTKVDNTAKKHWLPQTHCRSPYATSDCSGYKTPKTSTATTATSSG